MAENPFEMTVWWLVATVSAFSPLASEYFCSAGQNCIIPAVRGTGLSVGDRAMLLDYCAYCSRPLADSDQVCVCPVDGAGTQRYTCIPGFYGKSEGSVAGGTFGGFTTYDFTWAGAVAPDGGSSRRAAAGRAQLRALMEQ